MRKVLALASLFAVSLAAQIVSTSISTDYREDDLPAVAASPDGSLWAVWLSYQDRRDELGLRHYADGTWSNVQWVPNSSGDSWLPQIAVAADGKPWVVWSQMLNGNWDIYARAYDPAKKEWDALVRLTDDTLPDTNPRLTANAKGDFALVWQGFRGAHSNIFLKTFTNGDWSDAIAITERPANDWMPAVALDSKGTAWIAYDSYTNGNYDVYLTGVRDGKMIAPEIAVAETLLGEMMPTVAVDGGDRVWVSWEVAGANWGKDTGYTIEDQPGVVIGNQRDVAIAVYSNGRLQAPVKPLQPVFTAVGDRPKWTYKPHVFADADGGIWVAAQRRLNNNTGNGNRGYWEWWLTRYKGGDWSAAVALPDSWGRNSTRFDTAIATDGSTWLTWAADNRKAEFVHRPIRNQVFVGKLPDVDRAGPTELTSYEQQSVTAKPLNHPNESADLEAIRGYRTKVHERPVQIVRGDFHRHTELSWDGGGGNDGSLQGFYRYMIDAAAMDFGASTDHQGGAFEYWWWYSQKMTDMYHVPGSYVPIFGYERSVTQPHGHRNIFYADREGPVTPFFMADGVKQYELPLKPQGDQPGVGTGAVVGNDTKLLYEEVRRYNGVAISHTSGTRMGTDWRDNDPKLEPVVEIFQGARTNYEYEGAPLSVRNGKDDNHMKRAGFVPDGFVTNAWEKGYRLGIISSSDHGSTHYSYAMVYTAWPTRQGILDAIRRRHTYGATDNILLDVRMGDHFMGDEFTVTEALPIRVKVRGTNVVARVHILRGPNVIYTHEPNEQNVRFEFTDTETSARSGTNYYYVRVEQADGQVAWSSPMWVTR